jgi:2,3-bisphosphoglycerate-dependent phosphoglycerate mutase
MPSPLELWLVRHGQTTANADGILSGWLDVPLTELGEAQARFAARHLVGIRFDGVWSSDLARALATARIAWGEPIPDRRLRELHFGELEGRKWGELGGDLEAALLEFRRFRAPGGEDLEMLRERVHGFLGGLTPGRHLIFTHGGVVRLLTRDLGQDRFLPNGCTAILDWSGRRLLHVLETPLSPDLP